jgi:hypothetical protein
MDYEDYLIEEKSSIMAISRISQMLDNFISKNYYNFGKDKFYIDEIVTLNKAIQMVAYCMRLRRKECYLEIDCDYKDEFTYNSVISENI